MADVSTHSTLPTNLVSYWEMEESSGTRVDSHGANDLTDNATVGVGTGIIGNGADFEASNSEYLSITDAAQSGLDFTGAMSISLWLRAESFPATGASEAEDYLFTKLATNNFSYRLLWQTSATLNRLFFSTSSNGTSLSNHIQNVSFALDTWYHIVVTKSGTVSTIYINGTSAGTGTVTSTIFDGNAALEIGGWAINASYFDGILDEIGVWSKQLTSSEVTDLYNGGAGLPYLDAGGGVTIPTPTLTMLGVG